MAANKQIFSIVWWAEDVIFFLICTKWFRKGLRAAWFWLAELQKHAHYGCAGPRYALVLIMAQEGSILAFYGIIMNTQRLKNIECSQTFQMFPSPRQPNWNVNNVALLTTLMGCVATLIRGSLSQPLSLQPNWWTWVVFSWPLRLASAMRQVDVPGHHVMPFNFIFLIKRKADNAIISVKW